MSQPLHIGEQATSAAYSAMTNFLLFVEDQRGSHSESLPRVSQFENLCTVISCLSDRKETPFTLLWKLLLSLFEVEAADTV